jgi:hypothetical protein
VIASLGISLPCLAIPADLRMACTLAYRRWPPLLTVRYSTRTARRWLSRIGACLLTVRPLGCFAARARIQIICSRGCAGLPQDATG